MVKTIAQFELASQQPIPEAVLNSATPIVIRGIANNWAVVKASKQSAAEFIAYLRDLAKEQDVLCFSGSADMAGRFFYNDDMSGFNFDRQTCLLSNFLSSLSSAPNQQPYRYLGSTSVEQLFPGFRQLNDLHTGAINTLVSIWLGTQSRIAAHFDAPQNIACIIAGKRRFTLFPPEQIDNLYVGPLDFTPAGQAVSLVDFAQPDYQQHPKFEIALQNALEAELEPGDAIIIPSMWWHHVEGLDTINGLINYWWNNQAFTGNPVNALMHSLLSIKQLPAHQRQAWSTIFDHYIFSDNTELSHIPNKNLGILGTIDPQMAKQIRQLLRSKL